MILFLLLHFGKDIERIWEVQHKHTHTHAHKILCALLVHHSSVAVIQQTDQPILPCNAGGHFIHAVHTEKVPLLLY